MTLIGVDPGEVHTGVVILHRGEAKSFIVNNNGDLYLPARWLNLREDDSLYLVVEDYRVRPVGHQKFTDAKTARLIGALAFLSERKGWGFSLVNPESPDKLVGLGLFKAAKASQPKDMSAKLWVHVLSAWRIVGYYLLTHDPDELRRLGSLPFTVHGQRLVHDHQPNRGPVIEGSKIRWETRR